MDKFSKILLFSFFSSISFGQFEFNKIFIDNNIANSNDIDASADFDKNGEYDIIVSSYAQDKVTIYYQQNGLFEKKIIVSDKDQPSELIVDDIDNDNDVDFLLLAKSDYVIAYLNDGSGKAFQEVNNAKYTGYSALAINSFDFNKDGLVDIVVGYAPEDIKLFINKDNGKFDRYDVDNTIKRVGDITIEDLNQDGLMDILATSFFGTETYFYKNLGGVIPTFSKELVDNTLNAPSNLLVHDIDGDNQKDIVVSSFGDDKIYWFKNNNNTFTKKTLASFISDPTSLYLTDLNNDGDKEIVGYSQGLKNIYIYTTINNGASFQRATIDDTNKLNAWMHFEDLDHDNDTDIIIAGSTSIMKFENNLYSTSVSEFDSELFSIGPNPTESKTTINTTVSCILKVTDINGNLLSKQKLQPGENTVHFESYLTGLYFLHFRTEAGKIITKKILKI